jgi:hypothetical protein
LSHECAFEQRSKWFHALRRDVCRELKHPVSYHWVSALRACDRGLRNLTVAYATLAKQGGLAGCCAVVFHRCPFWVSSWAVLGRNSRTGLSGCPWL